MKRLFVVVIVGAAAAAACRSSPESASTPAARSTTIGADRTSPATSPSAAQAVLDRIDTRLPVPLLPMMANHQKQNMRDHLVALQEIVAGVGAGDFDAIEKAAKRIGYSEQMGQMCSHMGAGAPGFAELSLAFHRTADNIGDAARGRDMKAVLSALSETMTQCTSCHATFKQRVIDDGTLAAATPMGNHAPMHAAPP